MKQDKPDNELEQNIEYPELNSSDILENNEQIENNFKEEISEESTEDFSQNPDDFNDFEQSPQISDEILQDENFENSAKEPQSMVTVRPVKFQEFELTEPNRSIKRNLDIMQDISMHISVELGRAKSTIKEVMDYKEGSIVELDKIAGEQVEVYVNNKLVAKGEVIVIEDRFGVRVTSTSLPKVIQ